MHTNKQVCFFFQKNFVSLVVSLIFRNILKVLFILILANKEDVLPYSRSQRVLGDKANIKGKGKRGKYSHTPVIKPWGEKIFKKDLIHRIHRINISCIFTEKKNTAPPLKGLELLQYFSSGHSPLSVVYIVALIMDRIKGRE